MEGKTGRLVFEFVGRFFIGESVTRVSRERDFKDFLSSFGLLKKTSVDDVQSDSTWTRYANCPTYCTVDCRREAEAAHTPDTNKK